MPGIPGLIWPQLPNFYKYFMPQDFLARIFRLRDKKYQEFTIEKSMAEQQTKVHFDRNQMFWYARNDRPVRDLQNMLQRNPDEINKRDPAGASIIHVAYLFQRKIQRRWLIEKFPDEALEKYSNGKPYEGENILHIVIVHHDTEEIKWLLDFYGNKSNSDWEIGLRKLLYAQAKGSFFRYNGLCYFGEYPMLFAVCSGNMKAVDLLINGCPDWDYLFISDSHGNNALHMCVKHDLMDMYNFIEDRARKILKERLLNNSEFCHSVLEKVEIKLSETLFDTDVEDKLSVKTLEILIEHEMNERLYRKRNYKDHTVITLAASQEGSTKMFKFLLDKRKQQRWLYGPVKSVLLDMTDMEKYHDISNNKVYRGALDWICIDDQSEKLNLPEVRHIIESKWLLAGRPPFLWYGFLQFLLTAVLTGIICLDSIPYAIDAIGLEYAKRRVGQTITKDIFYLIAALYFLGSVIFDLLLISQTKFHWWGLFGELRGAGRFDKIVFYIFFCLFAIVCGCKLNNYTQSLEVALSLCVMLSWIHLYFFLIGFESSGRFVIMLFRIVTEDVVLFLKAYLPLLFGFSTAFYLMTQNPTAFDDSIGSVMFKLLQYNLNQNLNYIELDTFDNETRWVLTALFIVFNFAVQLVMLNLIIAMMGNTYEKHDENLNSAVLNRERYNIMDSILTDSTNVHDLYTVKHNKNVWFEYPVVNPDWKHDGMKGFTEEDIVREIHTMINEFRDLLNDATKVP